MKTSFLARVKKDFDSWAYNVFWPKEGCNDKVQLTVEDIKFAYNAWSLLRLGIFYNTPYPKVLSSLTNTTPSMDIAYGGNRLFHMLCTTDAALSTQRTKVALTPHHSKAVALQDFFASRGSQPDEQFELVLGMENGLSESVAADCDVQCYIPQYGSIGSLSMMSALAIATHIASSSPLRHFPPQKGHMPQSNHFNAPAAAENGRNRPHETDLLDFSNEDIKALLKARRDTYSLQLAVLMYNDFGDRNIAAVMRNANVYNCEKMIVVNRRKFSRRGAVGTNKLLDIEFAPTVEQCVPGLEGYAVWLLYPYYPYLHVYTEDGTCASQDDSTFLRPHDPCLVEWLCTNHALSQDHPLYRRCPHLHGKREIFLDNEDSLVAAVEAVKAAGYRGIMLAVPEEGASTQLDIERIASNVVFVTHPDRLPSEVQRGLNPALGTAIAFERIRTAIDSVQ